jgi:hypothetical protein
MIAAFWSGHPVLLFSHALSVNIRRSGSWAGVPGVALSDPATDQGQSLWQDISSCKQPGLFSGRLGHLLQIFGGLTPARLEREGRSIVGAAVEMTVEVPRPLTTTSCGEVTPRCGFPRLPLLSPRFYGDGWFPFNGRYVGRGTFERSVVWEAKRKVRSFRTPRRALGRS